MEYIEALKTNFHPKKSYRYFALNSAAQLMVNSEIYYSKKREKTLQNTINQTNTS